MAMDGEADSVPSTEIEQNKCVGVAIATFDVWKSTMDRNNQSGWLHNLWPTNYVVSIGWILKWKLSWTGLFGGHRSGQWTDKSGIAC